MFILMQIKLTSIPTKLRTNLKTLSDRAVTNLSSYHFLVQKCLQTAVEKLLISAPNELSMSERPQWIVYWTDFELGHFHTGTKFLSSIFVPLPEHVSVFVSVHTGTQSFHSAIVSSALFILPILSRNNNINARYLGKCLIFPFWSSALDHLFRRKWNGTITYQSTSGIIFVSFHFLQRYKVI